MQVEGFNHADFDVFTVAGLDERMEALKSTVRPKLEQLGTYFAPILTSMTGEEIFPHVAKHARRSVNPPDDTWVAFAANKRGYKKLPHFQIGLWNTHLFCWFAIIYEAPDKAEFGKSLLDHFQEIKASIPNNFVWSDNHMKPDSISHHEMTDEDFTEMFERLIHIKKAEILCGIKLDRHDPTVKDGQKLAEQIEDAFSKLMPLYSLARKNSE